MALAITAVQCEGDPHLFTLVAADLQAGRAPVRDLTVAAFGHRIGRINRLPVTIKWLSDNNSSPASSVLKQRRRPSKVRRAMEWPKHSHD
jgi:hypothetical protein